MLPPSFTPEFLSQLELLRIRSRRAFLGSRQGGHVSPKRGHGIEFSDYRKYEAGDNPRHIDWGVYARTDRLYVKRFQEEQDLSVLIVLDPSSSMRIPAAERKWETARDIALAVAYVALMSQDRVSICALGAFHSPSLTGGSAVHAFSGMLGDLKKGIDVDRETALQRAAERVRFPGVAVVISDLLFPFTEVQHWFKTLLSKNLDITAIQVLGPSDITPLEGTQVALAVDSEDNSRAELSLNQRERAEYGMLLVEHNQLVKQYLLDNRIGHTLALSSQSLTEIIRESVSETGLLR